MLLGVDLEDPHTGVTLPDAAAYPSAVRQALAYWWALALMVICVVGVYLLMRGRFGLDARAVPAEPVAASSAGVRVGEVTRVAYLLSALGTGAAGAVIFTRDLYVQPGTAFGIQDSVSMMFMVMIGGLGTIEGPIVGAAVFFGLQQALSGYGAWYLVLIGVVAMATTMFAPRGIWGAVPQVGGLDLPDRPPGAAGPAMTSTAGSISSWTGRRISCDAAPPAPAAPPATARARVSRRSLSRPRHWE